MRRLGGPLSLAVLFVVFGLGVPVAADDHFTGTVIGVSDGDTISVLRDRTPIKIRLDGIDCPESGQDFGRRAKQFTSAMVFGKTVRVDSGNLERYGRLIGRVSVDGEDLGLALVKAGLAWHYKQYSQDPALALAEAVARAAKVGLWSQSNSVAPWQFRHPVASVRNDLSTLGPLHGNVSSRVVHRPGCQHYRCKNCTRVFQTLNDAIAAGFKPADDCLR